MRCIAVEHLNVLCRGCYSKALSFLRAFADCPLLARPVRFYMYPQAKSPNLGRFVFCVQIESLQ